ncbi:hypothetical protein SapgrDRAFT_0169 [Saprospira grandis DSM 2844]|uniref:Uncharacterized protein n=1 Tax=Saprospira grandis DSM 2844 TaxID=694433 RepID=J1I0Y4_9BACT|nr:hypothetical protein SapgrDRAFT_0169 [Saprospira grandis DSM 2844]
MPFFSPKDTNCKRFSDHFCFFGAAPRLWLGSGYVAARRSARPCVFFATLKKTGSGLRPLLSIPQPNRSSALRPAFDKNFKLVKAFFKGIAVAMAEKNNAEWLEIKSKDRSGRAFIWPLPLIHFFQAIIFLRRFWFSFSGPVG